MTIKELIKLLKKYPNQDMEIMLSDSENGDEEPTGLREQKFYRGCAHNPKFDKKGHAIPNSGTYFHNEKCRLEVAYVTLVTY